MMQLTVTETETEKGRAMHFANLGRYESGFCVRCNLYNGRRIVGPFFAAISRLGNGIFWYSVMFLMPVVYGDWKLVLVMVATGAASTLLYRFIKSRTQRPRPCEAYALPYLTVLPLDRFSFPSGHTLHAVGFTLLATHCHPELGWVLVPFTLLVALSRLVLGLHYPSDVLTGAAIGSFMAISAISICGI